MSNSAIFLKTDRTKINKKKNNLTSTDSNFMLPLLKKQYIWIVGKQFLLNFPLLPTDNNLTRTNTENDQKFVLYKIDSVIMNTSA